MPPTVVRLIGETGHLRVAIPGIKYSKKKTSIVEAMLAPFPHVLAVRASASSGRVLIRFDPLRLNETTLLEQVERAMETANGKPVPVHKRNDRQKSSPASSNPVGSAGEMAKAAQGKLPTHPPNDLEGVRLPVERLLAQFGTQSDGGLSHAQAHQRLIQWGSNVQSNLGKKSRLITLKNQLFNIPVGLLATAGVLSAATGAVKEAVGVTAAAWLNGGIGYVVERRAERLMGKWEGTLPVVAKVIRSEEEHTLDAQRVVPGDLIVLAAGDRIPTDARLLRADNLIVDESILTGESGGVHKEVRLDAMEDGGRLSDRPWMVHQGSHVLQGKAVALVVATGDKTQLGQVRRMAGEIAVPKAPIEKHLDRLGTHLGLLAMTSGLSVLGIGLLRKLPLAYALRGAVALGCSAIPEGLPATATTTLALSSSRLRQRGVHIRRTASAEAVGAITTLCIDKTGTLTENRMNLAEMRIPGHPRLFPWQKISRNNEKSGLFNNSLVDAEGVAFDSESPSIAHALRVMALNVEAQVGQVGSHEALLGSATESALQRAARSILPRFDELHAQARRETVRQRQPGTHYVITVHGGLELEGEGMLATVKGAPESVLSLCSHRSMPMPEETLPLDDETRTRILEDANQMAASGQRVLGLASRSLPPSWGEDDLRNELIWHGLVGLADLIRPEAASAVAVAKKAGIRILVLTGDHPETAKAVCEQVGLFTEGEEPLVFDASQFEDEIPDLARLLNRAAAVSRVTPEEKLKIVRALQRNGEIVAMTGDGVNDAPALKAADVGIAMAGGADVARALGDVVLADNRLTAILEAVSEGRVFRDNILRSLRFLITTNLSEVLLMLIGIGTSREEPLTPIQLLWINLLTDVLPGLALGLEPPEHGIMERSPTDPSKPLLSKEAFREMSEEAIILSTCAAIPFFLSRSGANSDPKACSFGALVLGQLLHSLLCRGNTQRSNPYLLATVASMLALQAAAFTIPPLRRLLDMQEAPTPRQMALSLAGGLGGIGGIKLLGMTRAQIFRIFSTGC